MSDSLLQVTDDEGENGEGTGTIDRHGRLADLYRHRGVPAGLIFILDPSGSGIGFSPELLEGTPFSNYLLPGTFLFAVNGVATLVGGVLSFFRHRYAGELAVALGVLLIAWIVIQVAMIGLAHWLQPLYFGLGVVELVLGVLVWKNTDRQSASGWAAFPCKDRTPRHER
jgi:hypothetical protein